MKYLITLLFLGNFACAPLVSNLASGPDKMYFNKTVTPISVKASNNLFPSKPENVFNYQISEGWSSGGYAPQDLIIDLGSLKKIKEIYLVVDVGTAGFSQHQILGGAEENNLKLLASFDKNVVNKEVIYFKASAKIDDIRYLKIQTTTNPDKVAWNKVTIVEEVFGNPKNTPKYFGYFASAYNPFSNATNFLSDHNNLTWIRDATHDLEVEKLAQARAVGVKASMYLEPLFFNPDFTLRSLSEIKTRWAAYADKIRPYIDNVAVFYPLDEPYWQRAVYLNPGGVPPGQPGLTDEQIAAMKSALETIGNIVRETFPQVPLGVIFCDPDYPMLINKDMVPNNYDWVGFDFYGDWLYGTGSDTVMWRYNLVKSKLKMHQKMILFPTAFVYEYNSVIPLENQPNIPDNDPRVTALKLSMHHYLELSLTDPAVIGVFPFLYHNYDVGTTRYVGTQSVPAAFNRYREFGRNLLRK